MMYQNLINLNTEDYNIDKTYNPYLLLMMYQNLINLNTEANIIDKTLIAY